MYDPTDEFDQTEESSGPALGEGRRQTLDALDQKDSLSMIDEPAGNSDSAGFDSFEDLADAIREISLARPDGTMYMSPPAEIVETAESIYQALPDDAQPEYLADDTLRRRINTARRRFNDWMGALRRSKEMPSPVEAGRANYPADKAQERSRRAREASEELDDALDNVKSAVRGARQRALEAIGSSVAEQNEKENQSLRDRRKEILEPGWVVVYQTTSYGYAPWGVKRVNKKSVRLRRPHQSAGKEKPMGGGTYPEYDETTADLDSDRLIVPEASESPDIDEVMADQPDGITYDYENFDTWEAWTRHLMGDEWVEDNLDESHFFDDPGESIDQAGGGDGQEAATDGGTYDPTDEWTDDRPQNDTLVETTAKGQAARNRETRVETGASDEFADDRRQEETTDAGEQASLTTESVDDGGQMDLTGGVATEDPEYMEDSEDSEDSEPRVQQRERWLHVPTGTERTVLPGDDISAIRVEWSPGPAEPPETRKYGRESAVLDSDEYDPIYAPSVGVEDGDPPGETGTESFDGFDVDEGTQYPGFIGEWDKTNDDPPEYESPTGRIEVLQNGGGIAVTEADGEAWEQVDADLTDWLMGNDPSDAADLLELDDDDGDMGDWAGAVDYLRQHYSDNYQARIELASDLREFASEQGMDAPQSLGDEGVLQPLIRYQNVDPADAKTQIEDRAPARNHDAIFDVITAFGAAEAARHDESPDSRSTYDPCCEYDNPEEWGPTATRPISDVADELKSPEERRVEEAERERAEYEESPGGRMKVDEPDQRPDELDPGLVEALEGQTYDPSEDMDPGGTTGEVVQDLSKPPGVDAANAIADALSEGETAGKIVVGQRTLEVPEPAEGWHSVRFITSPSIDEQYGENKGTDAVYLCSCDEVWYTLVISGTVVSNKWSMVAYSHQEPLEPEGADYAELRYGPGGYDTESERWRVTWGNTASPEGRELLREKFPSLEEVKDHFKESDSTDESEITSEDRANATWDGLGDEFYGWELTDEGGSNTYTFKHRLGQRVVAKRGREEGWHVDLHNPDWPDHTKWLTDPDARDRQPGRGTGDRRREPVDLKSAYRAAYDEMARIYRQAEYDDDQYESATSNESDDAETEQDSDVDGWTKTTIGTFDDPAYRSGSLVVTYQEGTVRIEDEDEDGLEAAALDSADSLDNWAAQNSPADAREMLGTEIETEDDSDDQYESATSNNDSTDERPERIEFGSKTAADEFREQYPEHVHESDDRRKKTVAFEPDTPENVLDQAGTESMISSDQAESEKYGQVPLTDYEKDRLSDRSGWTWHEKGFHAQAAKALLQAEGGTPWLDYYDPSLAVDEHKSVIDTGKEMAVVTGTTGPGETGARDDSTKTRSEIASDLDEGYSRMCRRAESACSEGEDDACEALLEGCGYSEDEIAELMEATRELGESPLDVYDPTTEADETTSFEEWAQEQAPARPDPEEIDGPVPERPDPPTPDEPDDEELRRLAPTRPEEMSGATLGALKKAWAGYRMAREEDRQAHERMNEYAEIINGIRVVNDQEPIDFDRRDGWDGGLVLPDDPTEEYPVGDGTRQKSLSEAIRDGAAGVIEGAQATLGETYDPTEEF